MWDTIKRFLIIWLGLFLVLCVVSVIVHWSKIVARCKSDWEAYLGGIMMIAIIIGGIIMMLRSARR